MPMIKHTIITLAHRLDYNTYTQMIKTMKRFILFALLGIGSLAAMPAKAQVSLNVHIGPRPQPVVYYSNPRPVVVRSVNYYEPRRVHYVSSRNYYRPNVVVVRRDDYRGHDKHYKGHNKHRGNNGHGRGGRH